MNKQIFHSKSTFIGSGALLLWIIQPLLVSELEGFPLFESLSIIFWLCFGMTSIKITLERRWYIIRQQSMFVWLIGFIGICGSDFCYLLGAYSAPIAHVDLIDYLWPCLFVLFVGFIPNQKFGWKYVIGSVLGLIGVLQLVTVGGFNPDYILGYSLALYGVLIWGLYSMFSCYRTEIPTDMVGLYCGLGALVTTILHFKLETTVVPNLQQSSMALVLSLAGPGFAYQLWDHGIKFGDAKLLSILCYLSRVLAMALLVGFGKEPLSDSLVIACILAIAGVVVCSVDESVFVRVLQKIAYKLKLSRPIKNLEEINAGILPTRKV